MLLISDKQLTSFILLLCVPSVAVALLCTVNEEERNALALCCLERCCFQSARLFLLISPLCLQVLVMPK